MGSWYSKGKIGVEKSKQVDAEAKARREAKSGSFRFYLKHGTEAKIFFLDNPEFFFSEHNLKIGGSFYNYVTCLADFDTCPPCESGEAPSYSVAGTIIDFSKFEDRKGNKHLVSKKLFVARGKARQHILKQIDRRDGNLTNCLYIASRGDGQTECGTGEDFEFLKKVSLKNVKALVSKLWDQEGKEYIEKDLDEFLIPFDYPKEFAPKKPAELRKLLGGSVPVGSEEDSADDLEGLIDGEDSPKESSGDDKKDEITDIDDLL